MSSSGLVALIHWEVQFDNMNEAEAIVGFDCVGVSREEFDMLPDLADGWMDNAINEKIARGAGYPDNELEMPNFFKTINIESDINNFYVTKVEEDKDV